MVPAVGTTVATGTVATVGPHLTSAAGDAGISVVTSCDGCTSAARLTSRPSLSNGASARFAAVACEQRAPTTACRTLPGLASNARSASTASAGRRQRVAREKSVGVTRLYSKIRATSAANHGVEDASEPRLHFGGQRCERIVAHTAKGDLRIDGGHDA